MTPEQLDRTGHYVLGLLDGADRLAFEAEMARDPALRAAVTRLEANLQSLDDTVEAEPANPALWSAIERSLADRAEPEAGTVVALPRRAARHLAWMGMAASVVAALGIGYLVGNLRPVTPAPVMIAVLLNENDASPGAIVEAFADDSVRLVPLDRFEVPEGRIMQVWTLPDPATGPVSLGTFADPSAINLAGPDLPPPQSGQLYEITLEPAPGSPTGRPTGPILVKGFAKTPL